MIQDANVLIFLSRNIIFRTAYFVVIIIIWSLTRPLLNSYATNYCVQLNF